ncbi:YdeI/OmpD-associated family protein [Phyllobacterium endophyticum]|uniref:Bacteriocin-protection protein n=1 Tax=Phyllobacterium endophyticum TaxID=1149773 RepID=A0A2P7APN6_9HYPH|nr:YdeI/OmpD-associated family protein [Phyllobacterium endophyticum]MBB3233414.1 uncharacterized protein YdeI (YjbR/CyaY-like superfamily) [Phyllobacterium endophyticum]PSH56178.1 hypothetical protein CU100_21565 [Phyllobacterium endophyticum]TYR41347.1 hypothetical protein FY050_08570 [Phyllobacterium endophyticum]
MQEGQSGLPIMFFASAREFEAWLAEQPRTAPGIWLKLAKKGSGIVSISHAEAIESALCHGWIDSQSDKFDDARWLLRFTPRKLQSKWSERNRSKVLELIREGRMKPAGLAEIERATADGRWDAAYAPQSTARVPDDLQSALDNNLDAQAFFDQINKTNRYAILHRIMTAKQAKTRASRIQKFVDMLARGETIYPSKARPSK